VFAGINVTRQSGGVPVLPDGGVNRLYPLVCDGEDICGWKGTSWGFIHTTDGIILSRGTLDSFNSPVNSANPHTTVIGIYTKTGGKNSKYSWTPNTTNISNAATLHVQLFRHIFRDRYSETHNKPMPGMCRFEVIPPWRFMCTASPPMFPHGGEAVLAPCDRATFEALKSSVSSIIVCMSEFVVKRGRKIVEDDGDDNAGE